MYKSEKKPYLVHLVYHFAELLVVLQELIELSHRVTAELVGKTGHLGCGCAFVLAWDSVSFLAVPTVTADPSFPDRK